MSKVTTLPSPSKKLAKEVTKLTSDELEEVHEITYKAIAHYKGQADKLETAIGALVLGYQVGWKVLYIIHNKRTIRQYEAILGINFREFFPEEGPASKRSMGYKVAKELKKFWQVVSGDIKVDGKREISN
ncbi:MAG: hypothetical protein JKY98_09615 [Gammaproteobacteria bacterium]|nr:hypothetical protein [Gammaproteobacteria bacterium]